ncbi:unnamed protein product [Protopolystoma xenopodis]|uniref:Transmembrane 9 superfamily member n=1 Tax=Protopolystoma xenopodis TaxID=117903 RepID=A0A3S5BDD8_9PLAT|nr:unnamed protein product [Protopolystoma xenopodis]
MFFLLLLPACLLAILPQSVQYDLQDEEFWNPRLLIDNAQGEPKEIVSHEVEFVAPNHEAYFVEKRRIKGVFHETLELRHFPFDCQVSHVFSR